MDVVLILKTLFYKFERTLYALGLAILNIVDSKLSGQASIENSRKKVEEALGTLNEALNRSRKSGYTEIVAQADRDRDSLYRSIVLRIESDMLNISEENIMKNGEKLNEILIENGKAMERSSSDQTNQLESLFVRFDKCLDLIKENGIEKMYSNLKLLHKKFLELETESTEVFTNSKEIPWLRNASDNFVGVMNGKLLKRIEMEADEHGEPFITALNMINNCIDKAHKLQRARIARNETDDNPDVIDVKNVKEIREVKGGKEVKDGRDNKEVKDVKVINEVNEVNDNEREFESVR
jgi:hypothetical protein